ncbi:sigma-54 dependent transcriptional regulator [Thioalkalicoccus limnaeus]|uniref:Sigma-54 dependent transcriptional regulator n=1 Tax=Thioalkalicoccus limnaeus TaxID=120681 RepID=A0ABV4BHK3_9GAMM
MRPSAFVVIDRARSGCEPSAPPVEPDGTGLVHADPVTGRILALAERVARTEAAVMLSGESGTGKEMFARHIHARSARADGPFVGVNCAAIPATMLEATLFGYERGAFTGAHQAYQGKFEQAHGGTLLLDEITEMDLDLQAKLLRVLQEREIERIGGRRPIPLEARILATTNRDLAAEVATGCFRIDLYYRLNVFPLIIPSLRERRADILPIALARIRAHAPEGGPIPRLTRAAEERLLTHSWPGNVRELDNVIQRALILQSGAWIDVDEICIEPVAVPPGPGSIMASAKPAPTGLGEDLRAHERDLILDALRATDGHREAAAARLGISPRTLRYRIARLRRLGVGIPVVLANGG